MGCQSQDEVKGELIDYYNDKYLPIQREKEKSISSSITELLAVEEKQGAKDVGFYIEEQVKPEMEAIIKDLKALKDNLKHKPVKELLDLQIEAEEYALEVLEQAPAFYNEELTTEEYVD